MPTEQEQILYRLAFSWQHQARNDRRDFYPYVTLLDELMFHAELRFKDYLQFTDEGPFVYRLAKWLEFASREAEKQALFQLLNHLIFIDSAQMRSLYRDAYRRIIVPWLNAGTLSFKEELAPDFQQHILRKLRDVALYSLTESFSFPEFYHVNDLLGLDRPVILGDSASDVTQRVSVCNGRRILVLEDFVGTGKQAIKLLRLLRQGAPGSRLLFVPLIMLERAFEAFAPYVGDSFEIKPVTVVPLALCVQPHRQQAEPQEFALIRSVVKSTAQKVLRSDGSHDDPPLNEYGYGESGAMLVTCHNVPNNTLPVIHHKAPEWNALFRRVHHRSKSKDSLR